METLRSSWFDLACQHMTEQQAGSLWTELENHYTEKHRKYHNLEHVADLLGLAELYREHLSDYDVLRYAIWFHDIIYKPRSKNNEKESAAFVEKALDNTSLSPERVKRISSLVSATASHSVVAHDADLYWFLDFDLSILGSPAEKYLEYSQQIREEFKVYPGFLYRMGRKKVLRYFLEKPRIYHTEEMYDRLEDDARKNLNKELLGLV